MSSAQDLLTQFTGVTFSGDDDPQIQSHIQELLDDFRVDALRVEAAAEDRLLEEVERIRRLYCTQTESIDFYYRLLANDPSTVASPRYVVGSRPPQALELKFHPPVAAPVAADAPPAPLQRSRSLQEEFAPVDVQGTLEVVCEHLGLRYVKSSGGAVKFVLDSPDGGERSFSYANLPFRRLLEDSRMVHPVYARGIVEQRYYACMFVECTDEPSDPVTNVPEVLLDTLILPLLVKPEPGRQWVNDEHAHFQSALATVTGVATWAPFQSSISFDQWLPQRLLRKLCRRAGCPMESSAALMELRTELRKFLEAWLTVASHELQTQTQTAHRQESSIITCDTLLRCLPRLLYGSNRAELRVFGYGVAGNIRHVLGAQIQMVLIQVHPFAMLDEVAMSVVHDLVVTTMLDVARVAKSQSTQRGHLRATVTCGHPAPAEASKLRPWEYSVYEVQQQAEGGGDPDDDAAVTVVTMDDVLAAMHTLLPTPLTEQILRECTRALSRYQQRKTTANVVIPVPGMEIRHWIGLTFAPEVIALIVDTFFGVGDVCLTIEALISLTATAEYLAAKLLELSGNVAKEEEADHSSDIIAPHHLSMAIHRENTLRALYPGCILRYGGGGGHVPPATTLHAFPCVNAADPNTTTWIRTVDAYLASTVVATGGAAAAVPHVLCGGYIGPNDERGGGGDVADVITEPQYMWMPVLDGLAYPKLGEAKRQLMAIEAAPAEVQQAVAHLGADPASTWRRRLFELQREQRQRPPMMVPLFTYETMFALSSQVMQDIGPPTAMFTTNAVDLLATVSESFMVALVKDAFSVALEASRRRLVLGPVDIQMALARRLPRGAHA